MPSRIDRNQPKSKTTENVSLPQIKIDIPVNNTENGEPARSVKYNPQPIENTYNEDEPCYDSE